MKVLSIDPGLAESFAVCVVDKSENPVFMCMIDTSAGYLHIASEIIKIAKEYKVTNVVCEDFVYFYGSKNGQTITRMNRLLGFIDGYLLANGYNIEFVTSATWKRVLKVDKEKGTDAARKLLNSNGFDFSDKKKEWHMVDAFGIGVYFQRKNKN